MHGTRHNGPAVTLRQPARVRRNQMKRPPVDGGQTPTSKAGPITGAKEKIDWQHCKKVYNLFKVNCSKAFQPLAYMTEPELCSFLSDVRSSDGQNCVELLCRKEFDLVSNLVLGKLKKAE